MSTVEIHDEDERGILAFDLTNIADVVEPFATNLDWYVVEFEPVGLIGSNNSADPPLWVAALYKRLKTESHSVKIEWSTLKQFAHYIKQTIDMTLIGVLPGGTQPTVPIDINDLKYEIVIQAIDTSLWAVTSRNRDLLERIKNSFKETRIID
jgi:hypothetical protein